MSTTSPKAASSGTPAPNQDRILPTALSDGSDPIEVAAANPGMRIEAFTSDWSAIDRGRGRALLRGVADRVGFHHLAALLCPLARLALDRSGARVVIVGPR